MTAREYADSIWKTEELSDLSDFTIPLSYAIDMMEEYSKLKNLTIQRVSQRSELLPKITPHLEGHEPTCNCEPCDLLRKIFGNCG